MSQLQLSRLNYSPKEDTCFSRSIQVIIRATAFSFVLFVSSSKTSRNRAAAIFVISACSITITSREVIIYMRY